MSFLYEKVIAKALYRLNPETAHQVGLRGMGVLGACAPLRLLMERSLTPKGGRPIEAFGLKFPNHIGLAAGFDKDGIGWRGAAALGFGHVEVGTVTPKAQPGNEKPRVFRYPELNAVVNAYGFPNNGAQALHDRLSKQPGRGQRVCPLGINIGKNKVTANEQAHEDYLACFKLLAPLADYIAVNISSPNTTGLRALQDRAPLVTLLSTLAQENRSVAGGPVPLLLKIAPDLSEDDIEAAGRVLAGANGVAGEWGHSPLPWGQPGRDPSFECYCGQHGCIVRVLEPDLQRRHVSRVQRRLQLARKGGEVRDRRGRDQIQPAGRAFGNDGGPGHGREVRPRPPNVNAAACRRPGARS